MSKLPSPSSAPTTARAARVVPGRRRALGRLASLGLAGPLGLASLALARPAVGQGKRPAASAGPVMAERPEVQAFLDEVANRNSFDRASLENLFSQVRRNDKVLELMTAPSRPGARRIWTEYRGRFVDAYRIREGRAFWQRHAPAIRLASERSGVPEAIIVAIIGVETVYGRHTGEYRVIEALSTLGFDYPERAPYFRGELEQFLLYARENRIDPLAPRGSYAGATGLGQFMPTSLRRWAVDLDQDGSIDLMNSPADAVGSVGNFLKEHGWTAGKATHYGAIVAQPDGVGDLLAAGPKPTFTIEQLYDRGIRSTEEVPVAEELVLVDLPEGDDPTRFVLGTGNFYAITRYNRSYFYAMAVIELAEALKAR